MLFALSSEAEIKTAFKQAMGEQREEKTGKVESKKSAPPQEKPVQPFFPSPRDSPLKTYPVELEWLGGVTLMRPQNHRRHS